MIINNSEFINGVLAEIHDIVSDETLREIKVRLNKYVDKYNIETKDYSLAIREGVPDAFKHFLVAKKIEGLSDATLDSYKRYLTVFFDNVTIPMDKITSQTIQVFLFDYARQIHGSNDTVPSAHTMNQIQSILSTFFKWSADNGYISKNPYSGISKIKYQKKEIDVLTEQQIEMLRSESQQYGNDDVDHLRTYAMVETFLATGIRVSELVNIKLSDIKWNAPVNNVIPLKIVNGKGNKDRTVYLTDACAVAILDYLQVRNSDSEHLFVGRTANSNNKLTTRSVQIIISKLGKSIGVDSLHPHMIRHSVATEMAKQGTAINLVQKMLGHSDSAVTTQYYVKAEENQLAFEVATKLECLKS